MICRDIFTNSYLNHLCVIYMIVNFNEINLTKGYIRESKQIKCYFFYIKGYYK